MDQRDVTPWVRSVAWEQDDSMTRRFSIEFTAWHSFDPASRWDIFESYEAANPRNEIAIRRGLLDPAQRKTVTLSRQQAPKIVASGYEWVWLAQRKRPSETIIFVPSGGEIDTKVRIAIENYGQPIGQFKVWHNMDSNHDVIRKLMQAAGVNASIHFPRHTISAFVMPPAKSYFRQASDLAEPFSALPYYVRSTNTLVFSDQRDAAMGAGNTMTIPDEIVDSIRARPKYRSRPTRVIVRFPPWR